MIARLNNLRAGLYKNLDPTAHSEGGLSKLNLGIVLFVLVATAVSIIETEPLIYANNTGVFRVLNVAFIFLLSVEFLARFWVAAEHPGTGSVTTKRIKFVTSPFSMIDIVVLIAAAAPFLGLDLAVLRIVRLFRILALAKLGRFSIAMRHIALALHSRRFELWLTVGFALFLLIVGATLLYWAEGQVQPDKFGSIPRALWWSIVTLTTVGYGDVSPITPLGKIMAGFIAVIGIGLVALPTGILAAAFSDAIQNRNETED